MNLGWMSATVYWLNFCCSGNLSLPLKSLRDEPAAGCHYLFAQSAQKCADLTELLPARRFLAGGGWTVTSSNLYKYQCICYYRLSFTVLLTVLQ